MSDEPTPDHTTAHILCGECEAPIYYTDEGEHKCLGCRADDDAEIPSKWRIMPKQEVLDNAGSFL